jgi:sulfite reductase beta subunit-like hemoprotein
MRCRPPATASATSPPTTFAGAAADEVADPRPYAEILRQWSSVHPEFSYLPRKFKIAVTGAERDRAAIQVHDIGLHLKKNDKGEIGFAVYVGGGQGRTPLVAKKIRDFLPEEDLLDLHHRDRARVQPLRPARQQVQGAHQDPRPRDRRGGDDAARGGGVLAPEGHRADAAAGRY